MTTGAKQWVGEIESVVLPVHVPTSTNMLLRYYVIQEDDGAAGNDLASGDQRQGLAGSGVSVIP